MNEQKIFNFLIKSGCTKEGAAGIMGNLRAESAFNPINLQNSFNKKLGVTDEQYTAQVDAGLRNFIDSAGYGLAQWTSFGRKQGLFNYKVAKKVSIGDLNMQLEYLVQELKTAYKKVWTTCTTSHSIKECSDLVLHKFEAPRDQSISVENTRYKYAQEAYVMCAEKAPVVQPLKEIEKPHNKIKFLDELSKGDVVYFNGKKQYANSKATSGSKATEGFIKITQIAKNGIHQIHAIHIDKTSNVYGWVDLGDITK